MDENSINTLTFLSKSNINEATESYINNFEDRKQKYDSQKNDLNKLIYQFNLRKEQLFQHIEEFSNTKNIFITKSNQYFEDHQKKIIDLKDEIKLKKKELEEKENKTEKIQDRLRFSSLSIQSIKMSIRQLENEEEEIDNKMKAFQKIIKDGDNIEYHLQLKDKSIKQTQKLIKCSENSIEKYENLILKHELIISDVKLKINECYENHTEITERKNSFLARNEFNTLAMNKKIDELKSQISTKYFKDINNKQLSEISKNKVIIHQKIIDISNQFKSTNNRITEIRDEIQSKIKETQNIQKITEKPNSAIEKLRSKRIQRENFIKSKFDQISQFKNKIENKKKNYLNKISQSQKKEKLIDSEMKKINGSLLNEELKEKEISIQNDILLKEEEDSRKNEIEEVNKLILSLDQIQRKIELEKTQNFQFNYENNSAKSYNPRNSFSRKVKNNSKNLKKEGYDFDFSQNMNNDDLEEQILNLTKVIDQLNVKYYNEKQKFLMLQNQFQLFQSNDADYDDDACYKEIEKRIADGRLLFLQRILELSNNNKEIESQVQKKLERIENLRHKINELKTDEVNKTNLMVAHSSFCGKHISYQTDCVSRFEMICWLYLMIQNEKDEWLGFQNNIAINGRLQVWQNFLNRV